MPKSRAFEIAELIRHFKYDSDNDVITTDKQTKDKNKKRGSATRTATTQFSLDTFLNIKNKKPHKNKFSRL